MFILFGYNTVINKCLTSKTLANDMKITKVTPICLLPIINKILEKIINEQLLDHLEENKLLYKQQFGFRQIKSNSTWQEEKSRSHFHRHEKSVWNCRSKNFTTKNEQHGNTRRRIPFLPEVLLGQETEDISTGVAQGTNLAITLFLVYIDDIKDTNIEGFIFLYADDIVLVTIAENVNNLQEELNKNCENLHEWMTTNILILNTHITKYIIFRTPKKTNCNYTIQCSVVVWHLSIQNHHKATSNSSKQGHPKSLPIRKDGERTRKMKNAHWKQYN